MSQVASECSLLRDGIKKAMKIKHFMRIDRTHHPASSQFKIVTDEVYKV